ncbi:hypothetical protein [Glycomyces paridis]|uniref:hypothetical protein n=1 Tax=Glycomyces paridis TaxID=2126555 RepID=UPI0013051A73|nr:hypothetical protein [Glycomyces paridis]
MNAPTFSTAIMTHPARADRARELADSLGDLRPVVVVDDSPPGRGNLANAARAWGAADPGKSHHVVLQDDVIPCDGFADRLGDALAARPEAAVSLFCEWGSRTATLVRVAAWNGWSWARAVDMYTPTQGLALPREAALAFAAEHEDGDGPDDLPLAAFLRGNGIDNLVTVPNLVDHADHLSLTGNGFQGPRRTACAAPKEPVDFDTPTAGTGLARLPYASWMRVHAEFFACGSGAEYAWLGEFADTRLPEGLRKPDLTGAFAADLAAADLAAADPALGAAVGELVLFEYWTVHFALGLAAPAPVPEPGPLAEAAFATAFPGLFRRYLPESTVDALAVPAGRFAAAAYARGGRTDLPRPHRDWYE